MKSLSKALLLILFCQLLFACKKDRYIFTMKYLKLNYYNKSKYPSQNLSLKVVRTDPYAVLATTDSYPSDFTLPVTFALNPPPEIHLYKEHISIELWGDSSGLMAASEMDMKEYKIIYPIDMETGNDSVSFSVMGKWK